MKQYKVNPVVRFPPIGWAQRQRRGGRDSFAIVRHSSQVHPFRGIQCVPLSINQSVPPAKKFSMNYLDGVFYPEATILIIVIRWFSAASGKMICIRRR